MTERWLPVPGYEGHYEVSDLGRLRSLKPGRGMKRPTPERGYLRVWLWRDGKSRRLRMHQIVAAAFIGPCPPGLEVRHGNGQRDDNRATNLSYGTSAQNRADAVEHGTHNMARKTHCLRGHEFNERNTKMAKLRTGSWSRQCRACNALRARERRAAKR